MSKNMFWDYCFDNDVEKAKLVLEKYPEMDVNIKNDGSYSMTPLHVACYRGYTSIVSILLSHPTIDLNIGDATGQTPLIIASQHSPAALRLLIKDDRCDINKCCSSNVSPLYVASRDGRLHIVKLLLSSGRARIVAYANEFTSCDALGIATIKNQTEVISLLERYKKNKNQVVHELRLELGRREEVAATVFSIVIFHCDGLLSLKIQTKNEKFSRFFKIAQQLSMDLQMLLCSRVVNSTKDFIAKKHSEAAFKNLAGKFV